MCESIRAEIVEAILNDAVLRTNLDVNILQHVVQIVEGTQADQNLTVTRTDLVDSVKVAWLAGFAEGKREAVGVLARRRDSFKRGVSFNPVRWLGDLITDVEAIK